MPAIPVTTYRIAIDRVAAKYGAIPVKRPAWVKLEGSCDVAAGSAPLASIGAPVGTVANPRELFNARNDSQLSVS
jgi:hypothetical protein